MAFIQEALVLGNGTEASGTLPAQTGWLLEPLFTHSPFGHVCHHRVHARATHKPLASSGQLDFGGLVWNMDSRLFSTKVVVSRDATRASWMHDKCPLLQAPQVICP